MRRRPLDELREEIREAFLVASFSAFVYLVIHGLGLLLMAVLGWWFEASTRARLIALGIIIPVTIVGVVCYNIWDINNPDQPEDPEHDNLVAAEHLDKIRTAWMYDQSGNYVSEEAERVARAERDLMYSQGIEASDREVARQAKLHGINQ
jgi:hypothetical protein